MKLKASNMWKKDMTSNFLKYKKYILYISISLLICFLFLSKKNFALFANENYIINIDTMHPLMVHDVDIIEENHSYKIIGKDAQFVYDCKMNYCRGIRITFDRSLGKTGEVQVYYSEENQTFEEKNSIKKKIPEGENIVEIPIILKNLDKIRIDVDGLEGNEFNIVGLEVDERMIYEGILNVALIASFLLLITIIILDFPGILTKEKLNYIVIFLMIQSFFLIMIMADQSTIVHPDELVSKRAIDYYLNHCLPPDVRSNNIIHTFSVYGNTRLHELSVYYFLAGKIGEVFKVVFHYENYFRVFNILLYFSLIIFARYKAKNDPWLPFVMILTPQLWYIFSYATSDAWDYFCAVLLLYQSASANSILNKTLRGEAEKREATFACLAFGILSAFIMMGKKNYWTVLLVLFTIFSFKIIDYEKSKRINIIKSYAIILLCFAGTLALRYSINIYHYGLNENEIYAQVREERAQYAFKLSTPVEERYETYRLHDKGTELNQLIKSKDKGGLGFVRTSFESFVGLYGRMSWLSGDFYYLWMKIIYAILILIVYVNVLKQEIGCFRFYETIIITGIILLSIVLSIYNSWFIDFQPQGRYLFPMIIGFSYIISKDRKNLILGRKWCIGLIIVIQVSSMISFYKYALLPLIRYV